MEEREESGIVKKMLGLIGIVVCAVIGGTIYLAVAQINIFSAWAGCIGIVLGLNFYEKVAKKLSVIVVLIASVICSLMLYAAEIIDFANRVAKARPGLSIGVVLKNITKIWDKSFTLWLYPSIGAVLIFIAGFSSYSNYKKKLNNPEIDEEEIIDEEEAVDEEAEEE